MKRIRSSINFDPHGKDFQATHTGSKTLTVPDQSLSIPEIISRFSRGLTVDQGKVPIYEDDIDDYSFIDLRKLDFAERQELREKIDIQVSELKTKFEQEKKRKFETEQEQKIKLAAQKLLKEQKVQAVAPPSGATS